MNTNLFSVDEAFDNLYSLRAKQLSSVHWTPVQIAREAAAFLCAGGGANILDIGSGVGKFCIVGAHYNPTFTFYGIEQRKSLTDEALFAQKATRLNNIKFTEGNFSEMDMDMYDHFYFYNSFMENLDFQKPIDNLISTSTEIFTAYNLQLQEMLDSRPAGTRLATYHTDQQLIPISYKKINYKTGDKLILWIKNT